MYRIVLERLAQYGTSQLHEVSRYFYPPLYSSFLDPQHFAKASHSSFNAYSHTTCAAAAVQLHVLTVAALMKGNKKLSKKKSD